MQVINLNLTTKLFVVGNQVVGLFNNHDDVVVMMIPFKFEDIKKDIPANLLPDQYDTLEGFTDHFSAYCWTGSENYVSIPKLLNTARHGK